MKTAFLALSILLITGCATSAVPIDKATQIPDSRIFIDDKGSSEIVIIRDSGMTGGGCFAAFYVDNKLAAKLEPSEKASLKIESGKHMFGSRLEGNGLCSFERDIHYIAVDLEPNKTVLYRLYMEPNSSVVEIIPSIN